MGHSSFLKSPKKEEQLVPDTIFPKLPQINHAYSDEKNDIMDETLEGILGIENEENLLSEGDMYGHMNWDFMDWEGFSVGEKEESDQKVANVTETFQEESHNYYYSIKKESYGFWDDFDEQERVSLNLSLNYQEVLDAWSGRGRGSLWADEFSLSMANNSYMGEVPVMEEERTRREASVLRYKEKRQSRLFSKKIRYQVRKLNADKRPRIKGRFVKKVPEKTLK